MRLSQGKAQRLTLRMHVSVDCMILPPEQKLGTRVKARNENTQRERRGDISDIIVSRVDAVRPTVDPMRRRSLRGCFRTAASLISAPQPGFVGTIKCPFSMRGGSVTRSSFHGTSSMSISMMRKFGIAAQKWALISVDMWP